MSLLFRSTFLSVGLAFSLFLVVAKISANELQRNPSFLDNISSKKIASVLTGTKDSKNEAFQNLDERRAQLLSIQEKRLQNDNLEEFRKQQMREFELKKQDVMTKRKQCQDSVNAYMADRKTMRENLRKSCLPVKPAILPKTATESSQLRTTMREQQKTCDAKVKNFDMDTRVQSVTIRKSCFETERSVLGLSTEVPSQLPR